MAVLNSAKDCLKGLCVCNCVESVHANSCNCVPCGWHRVPRSTIVSPFSWNHTSLQVANLVTYIEEWCSWTWQCWADTQTPLKLCMSYPPRYSQLHWVVWFREGSCKEPKRVLRWCCTSVRKDDQDQSTPLSEWLQDNYNVTCRR